MSVSKTLWNILRVIPQRPEQLWGAQMTALEVDELDWLESFGLLQAGIALETLKPATTTLAASGTLTATNPWHRIASTPSGAIVLDVTTAIANGAKDGQRLLITGTSAADTVEIPDGANTDLNGKCVVDDTQAIWLHWDATLSLWVEEDRKV